jgi:hypothetical protein
LLVLFCLVVFITFLKKICLEKFRVLPFLVLKPTPLPLK